MGKASARKQVERETLSVLFFDVAGYSKLTEPQLRAYFENVLPEIAKIFDGKKESFLEINTWGDGIFAVTRDPIMLARLALDLRDFFRKTNWQDWHLPGDFACRISLNAGVVFRGYDPFRCQEGVVGSQINLCAR